MSTRIPIKKRRRLLSLATIKWSSFFRVVFGLLLIVYVGVLFQVNTLGSQIQGVEAETRTIERQSTTLQTKIYKITRDSNFVDLAYATKLDLYEPRDIALTYMQLNDTSFVMR